MRTLLTPLQRKKLKEHVYRSEGIGIFEALVLKKFWAWLVLKFPLWLAPNLMTMIGFVVTLSGTLCVILQDLNCQGKAPLWSYVFCAAGILIYQTLDGMDGMQARRTGTNNPLGEFFDHGLDAIATFLYAVAGACIPGLVEYPYFMFSLVSAMILLNFTYHWQTYVSGVLYFKHVDVCEAHIAQVVALMLTYIAGTQVWHYQTLSIFGIFYPLKMIFAVGTLFFSVLNFLSAIYIIFTRGVGKNGSTVADTSVISPIVTPVIVLGVASLYGYYSPAHLLETHAVLFMTAFLLPFSKTTVLMMLAGMTKSPFPLLDTSMLGPLLAYLNLYFGTPVPELYLISAVAVYNVLDVTLLLYTLCREFCDTLGVACFTIPYNRSKVKVQSAPSSSNDTG